MAGCATTRRLSAAASSLMPAKAASRTAIASLNPVRRISLLCRQPMMLARPAGRPILSRPSLAMKAQTRGISGLTPEQIAQVKNLVREEVLAELRAGGLCKEQLEHVKVAVREEILPVEEKALGRHADLTTDFGKFKLHEAERFAEVKFMQTEALLRVGTVSWRVCLGALSLTALILFEFYDVVKVGWQASVIETAKKIIDQKAQEIHDDLNKKLKTMLEKELEHLCAKHFLKGQVSKAATANASDDASDEGNK